jgi:hypothetical protein
VIVFIGGDKRALVGAPLVLLVHSEARPLDDWRPRGEAERHAARPHADDAAAGAAGRAGARSQDVRGTTARADLALAYEGLVARGEGLDHLVGDPVRDVGGYHEVQLAAGQRAKRFYFFQFFNAIYLICFQCLSTSKRHFYTSIFILI